MKALLVVDMQKDFMPGGPLGVIGGYEIIPLINDLIRKFPLVVASRDWHPKNHASFSESGQEEYKGIYWPVHCVQNSEGAEFAEGLKWEKFAHITLKGMDPLVDSYSTFYDNERIHKTDLDDFLKSEGVDELYVVGVATDYCVLFSVLDALDLGYKVFVIMDGCRAINLQPGDEERALKQMEERGAKITFAKEVKG